MIAKRNLLFILLLTFAIFYSNAQQVIFGTNNFIEYQVGTLPLVISVPHGGNLDPSSIPNRICNNPVYTTDEFTIETALEIKNKLFELSMVVLKNTLKRVDILERKLKNLKGKYDNSKFWI